MIASALLATSVIGVSGTILSSYAHDEQSVQQASAISAAESLMSELTVLPFTAGAANDVGLMDFASYSDSTTAGQATLATAKVAQAKGKTNSAAAPSSSGSGSGTVSGVIGDVVGLVGGLLGGSSSGSSGSGSSGSGTSGNAFVTPTSTVAPVTASRVVSIVRRDTLNGAVAAAGDLAIVTVDVTVGSGQVMRVRRVVSSTEAASGTP